MAVWTKPHKNDKAFDINMTLSHCNVLVVQRGRNCTPNTVDAIFQLYVIWYYGLKSSDSLDVMLEITGYRFFSREKKTQ